MVSSSSLEIHMSSASVSEALGTAKIHTEGHDPPDSLANLFL